MQPERRSPIRDIDSEPGWEELWKIVSSKDREEESESKDKTPENDAWILREISGY